MNMVKAVVQRLRQTPRLWIDVEELGALSQLDLKVSTVRTPALFVFPAGETASPDLRGAGPYLQTIRPTLGVVLVVNAVNGGEIDFAPLRRVLRERLFGWQPLAGYEPFWLGGGRLLSIQTGAASWLDNFVTEYTEDQNSYGA